MTGQRDSLKGRQKAIVALANRALDAAHRAMDLLERETEVAPRKPPESARGELRVMRRESA